MISLLSILIYHKLYKIINNYKIPDKEGELKFFFVGRQFVKTYVNTISNVLRCKKAMSLYYNCISHTS